MCVVDLPALSRHHLTHRGADVNVAVVVRYHSHRPNALVGLGVPRLKRRGPLHRGPPNVDANRNRRAEATVTWEQRHHAEPLEHRRLARALVANHDDPWRAPVLEDLGQDLVEPVENVKGPAEVSDRVDWVVRRRGTCPGQFGQKLQQQIAIESMMDGCVV